MIRLWEWLEVTEVDVGRWTTQSRGSMSLGRLERSQFV